MGNKELDNIFRELVSAYKNFKAEAIFAELLENSNIKFEDVDIANKSAFSRPFRRDVINYIYDTHSGEKEKLVFNLARNGLYDILPEGMFHQPLKTNSSLSYKEIRQKHKKEEKDARAFFAPLENEFFVQKVRVEQNERALIDGFLNLKNDFLRNFWGINNTVAKDYGLVLSQLLPFAHKISGKPELIAFCLEKILGEQVTVEKVITSLKCNGDLEKRNRLGIDFVLALDESSLVYPFYEINIGPVEKKDEEKYLENGIAKKFIDVFCDFFIPLEIETNVNVTYSNADSGFVLHEQNSPRMGLTTTI
ncbi:hypothetical protein [Ascidiimonas sp. W6]|uniref:hypothetical protein n=1 Tax=Ascidiimonas meishanensis TaxID=3128903 RepID=UPI0030EE3163